MHFSVTPGEYRKTKKLTDTHNAHIHEMLHQLAHQAVSQGRHDHERVDVWTVVKPERMWVSVRRNNEG